MAEHGVKLRHHCMFSQTQRLVCEMPLFPEEEGLKLVLSGDPGQSVSYLDGFV